MVPLTGLYTETLEIQQGSLPHTSDEEKAKRPGLVYGCVLVYFNGRECDYIWLLDGDIYTIAQDMPISRP